MGLEILNDVFLNLEKLEPDVMIYVPLDADVSLDTPVTLIQFDVTQRERPAGLKYFLEVGTIREVLEGLDSLLGKELSMRQRLNAVKHYATYDAHIDIDALRGDE